MKPSKVTLILLFIIHGQTLLTLTDGKHIEESIALRLYRRGSKHYVEAPITKGQTLFNEELGFDKELPIILIVHGMAMGADSHFIIGLVSAFFERQINQEYNILALDMPKLFENNLFNNFYFGVLRNVEPAAQVVGEMLNDVIGQGLTSPDKLNLIGYSIGAQIAGYIARAINTEKSKVNYIAGLDPAGPGFHTLFGRMPRLTHVSKADANVTHFFHANSILCGTQDRVGTADFIFNGGDTQPGCTRDASLDCSHSRIPFLYIEVVADPRSMIARLCPSWFKFMHCHCQTQPRARITFPPDLSANGTYYLFTRAVSPYGLGYAGARCHRTSRSVSISTRHRASSRKANVSSGEEDTNSKAPFKRELKHGVHLQIISRMKMMENMN